MSVQNIANDEKLVIHIRVSVI